ncbi:hypothetical protein ACFE04_018025 [Oxalis oulophora]
MAVEANAKGNESLSSGDFASAVTHFSDAIDNIHVLYSNRSAAYASLRNYNEALKDAEKTVELKPDWVMGYRQLGTALVGMTQYEDAIVAYSKGLKIDPNDDALKGGLSCAREAHYEALKADVRSQSQVQSNNFSFSDVFGPDMWENLMMLPITRDYMQQADFKSLIHDLQKNINSLKDHRVMEALGLTPQNLENLVEQVKEVKIDNIVTLVGLVSQVFDKALMNSNSCEIYVDFYLHMASQLPVFTENDEKYNFKRLFMNKWQLEFEKGVSRKYANQACHDIVNLSDYEIEVKRRRMLGIVTLLAELYKKGIFPERRIIMHSCIEKLLGHYHIPDEGNLEALCKLMSMIGDMIDRPKVKLYMNAHFKRMALMTKNMELSSRIRFLLSDTIEMRSNKWEKKWKIDHPYRSAVGRSHGTRTQLSR